MLILSACEPDSPTPPGTPSNPMPVAEAAIRFPLAPGDPIENADRSFGQPSEDSEDTLLGDLGKGSRFRAYYLMHEVNRGPIVQSSTSIMLRYNKESGRIWWIGSLFPRLDRPYIIDQVPLKGVIEDAFRVLGAPTRQAQTTIILTDYGWLKEKVGCKISAHHKDCSDPIRGSRMKGEIQYFLCVSFEFGPARLREAFLDL